MLHLFYSKWVSFIIRLPNNWNRALSPHKNKHSVALSIKNKNSSFNKQERSTPLYFSETYNCYVNLIWIAIRHRDLRFSSLLQCHGNNNKNTVSL